MRARLSGRHLALMLMVVAILGYSFVLIRVALDEAPPFALVALRFFFAAVPMCFFVPRPRMPLSAVVGYGLAIGVFQFGLLFLGMQLGMPAGVSSVVIQVQAFFTMALGMIFMHERIKRHNIFSAIIGITGMVILAGYKVSTGVGPTLIGFALVVAAALSWAIGNIVAKRAAGEHAPDMFSLVVWSSLVPPLPLAALSYALEGGMRALHAVTHMSLAAWAAVLGMSYGATLFGFGSWNRLLHRYPTTLISPFALLIPVSGLASGMLFLGESIAPVQALGIALVLAGLVVNVYAPRLR